MSHRVFHLDLKQFDINDFLEKKHTIEDIKAKLTKAS